MTRTIYDILADEQPHPVSITEEDLEIRGLLLADSPDLIDPWDDVTGNEQYPLNFEPLDSRIDSTTSRDSTIGRTALVDIPHMLFVTQQDGQHYVRMEQTLPKLLDKCYEKLKLHAVPETESPDSPITIEPGNDMHGTSEAITVRLAPDISITILEDDLESDLILSRPYSDDVRLQTSIFLASTLRDPKINVIIMSKHRGGFQYDDTELEHLPEILETLEALNIFADSLEN